MRRLVTGSQRHAWRRLDEMEAAKAMLETLGVEPLMTESTVASLRRLTNGAVLPELPPSLD